MRINNNLMAMNTHRQLGLGNANGAKSMEKLSSGFRINRAGDDAAGLAISEKMRGQIRGLNQASRNAQDGISMIQTAEGALSETQAILQRMKELATQSANGTNTDTDRAEIQKEINQLSSEINRIGNTTEFNTQKLLDGGASANATALGSNEAVGEAARGATVQSTNPAGVKTGNFALTTSDSAIKIGGAVFALNGAHNATAVGGTSAQTAEALKTALESLTTDASGIIKLGDLADVSVTENGVVTITTKQVGSAAEIQLTKGDGTAAAPAAALLTELGLPSTTTHASVFKGTNGTSAEIEGGKIDGLADLTKDSLAGKKFDITLNGETTTIEYTVADLTANPNTAANLVTVTQAAIDRVMGANKVTVAQNTDGDGLKFTQHANTIPSDGSVPALKVSGDYAATLLGGITDGQNAIGGTFTSKFQIGANNGQSFQMDVSDMRARSLGVTGDISGGSHDKVAGAKFTAVQDVTNGTNNTGTEYALDVSTHESATAAIEVLDNAIQAVSAQRSQLGAYQNRLEHTIKNLDTSSENLQAAESRIRDVDMAKEMMEFTKNNILQQAAQAMLAQANQQPSGILQLLR